MQVVNVWLANVLIDGGGVQVTTCSVKYTLQRKCRDHLDIDLQCYTCKTAMPRASVQS